MCKLLSHVKDVSVHSFELALGFLLIFARILVVPQWWIGYKVHLTESCDEDQPRLITHVETGLAGKGDVDVILPRLCGGGKSSDRLFHKEKNYGQDPKNLHCRV